MQPSISIVANEDFFNRNDFRNAFTKEWATRIAISTISEFDPIFYQTNIVVVAAAISKGNQRIGGVDGKYASLLRKLKGFYLLVYSEDDSVEYDYFTAEAQQTELEKVRKTFLWKDCATSKQNVFDSLVSKINECEVKGAIGKRQKSVQSLLKFAIIGLTIALSLVIFIDSGFCQYHYPNCSGHELTLTSLNKQLEKLNLQQKEYSEQLVDVNTICSRCTSTLCNTSPDKEMFLENFFRYCSLSLLKAKGEEDATIAEPCYDGRAHLQFLKNTTITNKASIFLNTVEAEKKLLVHQNEKTREEISIIQEEITNEIDTLKSCKSTVLSCWKLWNWELPK